MNESKLRNLIETEYSNIAGINILENGKQVYEYYGNNSNRSSQVHIYSCTKSIMSLLIGIAADQGIIKSTDQPILSFFPDYQVKRGEHTIQKITVKDMLTMTVPYKYKSAPYTKYFSSEDWVKSSLDLAGGRGAIGDFRYAPLIGPDILSGILRSAAGITVLEFAQKYLFSPLQIDVRKNILFTSKDDQMAWYHQNYSNGWVSDRLGNNTAAWGLELSAREMAKIGQLCLNEGIWNNQRIISSKWIRESTSIHAHWKEAGLDYGYLWWIHANGFMAVGDCGNIIYVNKKRKMVIAINSLYNIHAKDRIPFIKEVLEPLFDC
jgi:CubicO group peptidase (beta-lactamase class C family)